MSALVRPLAVAAVALGAAAWLSLARIERTLAKPFDVAYVPSGAAARVVALGHRTMLSDLYWLQLVQYVGDSHATERGFDRLYPFADLVTDLDPRHGYAYQVGGNVLAGVGRVAESNRLLEKGIRNIPDRYILPFHRAVNAFLYGGDYAEAGRWFERAAATPGAPPHLRENVVAMYVKGNQAEAAISFLTHLLRSSPDPESRKALEKQLERARIEEVAASLDEALEHYRARFTLGPLDVQRLSDTGILPRIPRDPLGGFWFLGDDGRVHSSVNPQRYQRPLTEAERRASTGFLGEQMKGPLVP